MNLILGGGLAGLSCSYHIGHEHCLVLEKNQYPLGHACSVSKNGFVWDEGPHISFTNNEYVKNLFSISVDGEYVEFELEPVNYYNGIWINHPVQSNLYQVSEPLRTDAYNSIMIAVNREGGGLCNNYEQWARLAVGDVIYEKFIELYTKKYWTTSSTNLTTDWVGRRVFKPDAISVKAGYDGKSGRSTHYIKNVRYPKYGGFGSFGRGLTRGANIRYGSKVEQVDLKSRCVCLSNGETVRYDKLINTIPLPKFVSMCKHVPDGVLSAAEGLSCSSIFMINIEVPERCNIHGNLFYIYDEDKFSTRISLTERFSKNNVPDGWSGIQVEVYYSKYREYEVSEQCIIDKVLGELLEMGFISEAIYTQRSNDLGKLSYTTVHIPWANVIFDHERRPNLEVIFDWLEKYGLVRENDELESSTDWERRELNGTLGSLVLAGRFGQWKYFWSDDCILRGKVISES